MHYFLGVSNSFNEPKKSQTQTQGSTSRSISRFFLCLPLHRNLLEITCFCPTPVKEGAFHYLPDILIGIQMERSVSVSSDWNILACEQALYLGLTRDLFDPPQSSLGCSPLALKINLLRDPNRELARRLGIFWITSGGGPHISDGIFPPKFANPFLTNWFFALI